MGASRHSFKTIEIEGGMNNRRLTEQDELLMLLMNLSPVALRRILHGKVAEQTETKGAEGQGKPRQETREATDPHLKELEAVSCENELEMAKFEEKVLNSSKPLKMTRETVKVGRYQMKEVEGKPTLDCCLTGKHILESVHWIM